MKYIIKLFPEILLKSKSVRNRMGLQLQRNLRRILKKVDGEIKVFRYWDKLEVICPDNAVVQVQDLLGRTPGIDQYLQVNEYPLTDLQTIAERIGDQYLEKISGRTFAVRCKRSGKHDFTSMDVDRYVGSYLFEHGSPKAVNLKNPDIKVDLEIHQDQVNIVIARYPGMGGYPLGIQDACLSLMSGGFDSTVASYETIKRGVITHFLFFNLGGKAHEIGVKQVAFYLWKKYAASHQVKFITVPFDAVVAELFAKVGSGYMGVVLKRMMMRAADVIATQMQIDALVTGESIAQVSSQTLRNLAVIDQAADKLVLRPLITANKQDIISTAERIGTREFAENMPEYCGVISRKPVIFAKPDILLKEESGFNLTVLDDAIQSASIIDIETVINDVATNADIETVDQVGDRIVIDIRRPEEYQRNPLKLEQTTVLTIPFAEINHRFAKLDQKREYLLYCEHGVMSQLHAQYLHDAGFENVRVYRPGTSYGVISY